MDRTNDMRLQDLQARIAHAEYTVDPHAVAEALLRRGGLRALLGAAEPPCPSAEAVLVARQLHGHAV
jgi:hypothetical protein